MRAFPSSPAAPAPNRFRKPMPARPAADRTAPRLPATRERLLWLAVWLMVASGLLWLWAEYAWPWDEETGPAAHEARNLAMRLHVAAALAFVFLVGALLDTHVRVAWRRARNRASGVAMLVLAGLLTVSGYGLWYFHGDALRAAAEWLHWIAGFAAPALLWLHARIGAGSRPPLSGTDNRKDN